MAGNSLFVPHLHDFARGVQVGTMTVHKNGTIEWNQTTTSPDTCVAYVYANWNKERKEVRLDAICEGEIPDWLGERVRQAMLKSTQAHRRDLEKQYYINRNELITGKMRRYNRLA